MKRIIVLMLFYNISSLFINLLAQEDGTFHKKADPNLYVHWFYVKAEQKVDRVNHKPVYVIRTLSKTPKSGKIGEYERDLYRCLQGGQQLTIGPFLEYQDAIKGLSLYDLARHTEETMAAELANFTDTTGNNEYYYYTLKYSITSRTRKYVLERTAAAVASGSLKNFREILWEGLTTLNLMIGPFTSQVEAEDSKSMYRSQEEK